MKRIFTTLYLKLRWKLWRGKICTGTGKRCKAMNCNISPGNCYVTYSRHNSVLSHHPATGNSHGTEA